MPASLLRLLVYLALAGAHTRILTDLATRTYGGGGGDPGQDAWILSRVTHQLLHEPWRPFEGNLYFPSHHSVLFCDPLLGPAVLVLPLRLVTANPVLLYNAAVLLALAVASLGFDRLARRLGASPLAAVLAGIAIPYSSQQMARLYHLNLLALTFFPFLIHGLLDLLERSRASAAVRTGVAFALQAATSGYHAFSCVLVSLVAAAWGARFLRSRRTLALALLAALIALALLYPYVSGFLWLRANEGRMVRDASVPAAYGLDWSWLFVSRSYAWRTLLRGGEPFFPGLVVLVFAALGLREFVRDRYVRFLALLAVVSLILAAGPELRWRGQVLGPGPFGFLREWLPLLDAMRHPFTLAVPALIALGLLASLGLSRSSLAGSRTALVLVLVLAAGETASPAPGRSAAPRPVPSVYTWLQGQPAGGVLELPFDDDAWTHWAAHHQLPIVNGVGAFEPERYQVLWQLFRRDWRGPAGDMEGSRSLAYLKAWFPIRYVVVHAAAPGPMRASAVATVRSLEPLHLTPDGDRVYRLHRGGTGPLLRRAFREDQLRAGAIRIRLQGSSGRAVSLGFNGRALGSPLILEAEPRDHEIVLPRGAVRRGLNVLELRTEGDGAFELLEIDAG